MRVEDAKWPPLGGRGETLVETLVSVVLLAIVAIGVVGALGSDILFSARDRENTTSEAVLRSFASWVDRNVADTTSRYHEIACGGAGTPAPNPYYGTGTGQWTTANLGFTAPTGFSATVVRWGATLSWGTGSSAGGVGYWPDSSSLSGTPVVTCPAPAGALLQLTLRVEPASGRSVQSLDVVVRRP